MTYLILISSFALTISSILPENILFSTTYLKLSPCFLATIALPKGLFIDIKLAGSFGSLVSTKVKVSLSSSSSKNKLILNVLPIPISSLLFGSITSQLSNLFLISLSALVFTTKFPSNELSTGKLVS